jgi:hypothetical protein
MAELTPGWRKSSHSVSSGGANCVEVGAVPWRRSSHSINSGGTNCVETGTVAGAVLIRDTKDNGAGPVLRLTPADWSRLTSALRADTTLG